MKNWKTYSVAALALTVAGIVCFKTPPSQVPTDLHDAVADKTSAGEFSSL